MPCSAGSRKRAPPTQAWRPAAKTLPGLTRVSDYQFSAISDHKLSVIAILVSIIYNCNFRFVMIIWYYLTPECKQNHMCIRNTFGRFLIKTLKINRHSVKMQVNYLPAPNVETDTVIPSKTACAVTLHYHFVLFLLERRDEGDGWYMCLRFHLNRPRPYNVGYSVAKLQCPIRLSLVTGS